MFARHSRRGPSARTAAARLRRLAAVLAAVTCGLLAWAAAAPAAFAMTPQPQPYLQGEYGPGPLTPVPATARMIITGGMPGWQITLIAAAAALAAATVAVVLDRARAARRAASATTA
jgi:hypothetical protein